MTPLDKTLKRVLMINGRDYVITLTPHALKITQKGHRLGVELEWPDLISGESALAVALHASIGKFQDAPSVAAHRPKDAARPTAKPKATPVIARRKTRNRAVPRRSR
jgi:hypothetical protein